MSKHDRAMKGGLPFFEPMMAWRMEATKLTLTVKGVDDEGLLACMTTVQ